MPLAGRSAFHCLQMGLQMIPQYSRPLHPHTRTMDHRRTQAMCKVYEARLAVALEVCSSKCPRDAWPMENQGRMMPAMRKSG
ncbi:hypothetical protein SERLA73DRAFT_186207 [Serpula lacrymans var. lacrymans S7.3]|uniref:Uncharacterized protein n=2 Tax=Serpula lacrymans var. lacrymans TaxID=341189 RepID=F8Q5J5_SERL3|nr:uncharacterized protein SERLADRAFT_475128 [Serpula lacrymans var. lacrymans S7.9]EGN96466.1 hypothetical protein SERLA73DRAFT_186207 [Serpula lacrymans var. lacrymans S7.3]EGO22015.1 hypothetical protein SERLADRAFT_475128 [Serpula lacrymans var. lacrymans S7.9]